MNTKIKPGFLPEGVAQMQKNTILEDQMVIRERYPMAKDLRLHTMAMVIRKEMNEKTGEIYKLGYLSGRDRVFSVCGFSRATSTRKWSILVEDGYVHADHKYAGKRHRLPSVWYCRPEALKVTNQELTEPSKAQNDTYFQVGTTSEPYGKAHHRALPYKDTATYTAKYQVQVRSELAPRDLHGSDGACSDQPLHADTSSGAPNAPMATKGSRGSASIPKTPRRTRGDCTTFLHNSKEINPIPHVWGAEVLATHHRDNQGKEHEIATWGDVKHMLYAAKACAKAASACGPLKQRVAKTLHTWQAINLRLIELGEEPVQQKQLDKRWAQSRTGDS